MKRGRIPDETGAIREPSALMKRGRNPDETGAKRWTAIDRLMAVSRSEETAMT
jgi:hypothetical protein